jgi:inosose dehydratase
MDESEWYPPEAEGVLDPALWPELTAAVQDARRLVEDEHGLKLSFHPHIGTAVETEAQIDRLLADTDVDLCLDTGHHAAWGQDPLDYMQRVWDRIAYVHLKNVDPAIRDRLIAGRISVAASYGAGLMAPLDAGAVDIPAVMRLLAERNFQGPVVVEQDVATGMESQSLALARRNRDFLARAA